MKVLVTDNQGVKQHESPEAAVQRYHCQIAGLEILFHQYRCSRFGASWRAIWMEFRSMADEGRNGCF